MATVLKPYMAYSRYAGPGEGAILIFAHNGREAKKIGWLEARGAIADEYIEFAVRLIRDRSWINDYADPAKVAADCPHAIFDCPSCKDCETWGGSPLVDGLCEDCRENREDQEDFNRAWHDAASL